MNLPLTLLTNKYCSNINIMKKASILLHPYLFASYPVLFMFAHNIKSLRISDLFLPLIVVLISTFLIFQFSNIFIKNKIRSSLITSLFVFIVLSYGHVFDFLRTTPIDYYLKGKQTPVFITALLIIILFSLFILKRTSDLIRTNSILNRIGLILLVFVLYQYISFYLPYFLKNTKRNYLNYKNTASLKQKPDIYYFIFDRYARDDTLQNEYDFDNSEMTDFLKKSGFYIAQKSWANYTQSQLSITSSLNMQYIQDLISSYDENSTYVNPLINLIEDHEVWRFLKSRGYLFYHAGSWWGLTAYNHFADVNINLPSLPEFTEIVYSKTIFHPITIKLNIPIFNSRLTRWKRPLYKFNEIAKIPDKKEPTFTFAHFLLTHEPFLFDSSGNFLSQEEIDSKEFKENYREQLIFANKKIKELISTIISKSGNNKPLIIIQADEGPYPDTYKKDRENFDWSKADSEDIRTKMAILNAYYFPDGAENIIPEYVTPVNSFRYVFNNYFGQNLPIPENNSYLSNLDKPFKFFKITRDPH